MSDDFSDDESVAMSVESSPPCSPTSPSASSLAVEFEDELPIRKRRSSPPEPYPAKLEETESTWTTSHECNTPEADISIHPSRLKLIEQPTAAIPIPKPPKTARRPASGILKGTIKWQVQKIQPIVDKLESLSEDEPSALQTLDLLQQNYHNLKRLLVNPCQICPPEFRRDAECLRPRAEAVIDKYRPNPGTDLEALDAHKNSEDESDGSAPPPWRARTLNNSAVLHEPPDNYNQRRKRRRLSSAGSSDSYIDHYSPHQANYSSAIPLSTSPLGSNPTFFASPTPTPSEIDAFLDSIGTDIYTSVLANLCPDNMRGSYCRTPDTCIAKQLNFACPDYAILKECPHEKTGFSFSHVGHKHTTNGCMVHQKKVCDKRHADGRPCRVEVVYYHVRASCMTLRGRKHCQKVPCEWGHDFAQIRREVMGR